MPLFDIKTTKTRDEQLLKKTKSSSGLHIFKTFASTDTGGTAAKISAACAVVDAKLSKYAARYEIIEEADKLRDYLVKAKEIGIISIDTETGGLDVINNELAGICLFTPGQKGVYVPTGHYSYITGQRIVQQVSSKDVAKLMKDFKVEKNIFHNAKFDIRVLRNQLGVEVEPFWDTLIAAKLLNENEESHSLKPLHKKYVNPDVDDYKFDTIFKGIKFNFVPIKSGYIYAARDAEITYELYEFQRQYLNEEKQPKIYNLFKNTEMPLIKVVSDMEDTGIELDFEVAENLKVKYEAQLVEVEAAFNESLEKYAEDILEYRQGFKNNCKLSDPINISSPTQISILLYDILGLKSPDKRAPRGTGEEILKGLIPVMPELEILLKHRELKKLLNTYIISMPNNAGKDGRIHCNFNQIGTVTGRFSSTDPNMQNIPAHNKEIRTMFRASNGKVLIGCDYSQQEPRILAHLSGDKRLIAELSDRDVYGSVGAIFYNKPFDYVMKTKEKNGLTMRDNMKAIVLALSYDKGKKALAEDLKVSVQKGEELYNKFFDTFPDVKRYIKEVKEKAKAQGYVETLGGRKRRLPDMQLEEYEMHLINGGASNDVLDFEEMPTEQKENTNLIPLDVREDIERMMKRAVYFKERLQVIERVEEEYGVKVIDNSKKIAEASRQCANSEIQGSAADMTKRAMLAISRDKRLAKLGYKLLLPVHDELIGEADEKNAVECGKIVCELMIKASQLSVPMKVDCEITKCWYGEKWGAA